MASPVRHIVILLLWYDTWFFVHDFIKHFNGKFSWCCKIVRACGADRSVCLSVKSQPPTGFLESKKTLSEFFFSFCFGFQQILDEFTSLFQVCHRQYSLKKKIYFLRLREQQSQNQGWKNMKQCLLLFAKMLPKSENTPRHPLASCLHPRHRPAQTNGEIFSCLLPADRIKATVFRLMDCSRSAVVPVFLVKHIFIEAVVEWKIDVTFWYSSLCSNRHARHYLVGHYPVYFQEQML